MMKLKVLLICVAGAILAASAHAEATAAKPDADKTVKPGSYQIRNQKYGNLLRPEDANNANGTRIVLYPAQPWKCMTWRLEPNGESQFQLQNHFTSKTFAAEAADKADAAVTQTPFGKKAEERPTWRFTKLSDGAYKIEDAKTGKALTAVQKESGSTVTVVTRAWQESGDQKWELIGIDPKDLTM